MAVSGSNTAEGISIGSAPTAGNSGGASGTALSTIATGDSSSILVTTAALIHGTRGFEFTLAGNSTDGATRIMWPMAETGRLVFSFYVNIPVAITQLEDLGGVRHAAGNMCILQIGTDGKVIMQDASGTSISASKSPNTCPTGIVRFDIACAPGAANGVVGYAYYLGGSNTPVYSWESSTANTTANPISASFIGRSTGRLGARTLYYDTIRWATTASGFMSAYVDQGGTSGTVTQLGVNTAEGIPLNTSLTSTSTALTGGASGTAASVINVGAASQILVTNFTTAHGSRGYFFDFAGSTADGATRMMFPCVRSDRVVLSFYVGELSALPGALEDLGGIRNSSGNMCILSIGADGKLIMSDAGGTVSASRASAVFPIQTKIRVDISAAKGTDITHGTVGYSYYLANSSTPIFTWEDTGRNAGTTDTATVFVGRSTGRSVATDLYIDTIRWGYGSAWFGLYAAPKTAPYADLGGDINDIEPYTTVQINCMNSFDTDGQVVSYALTQTSGIPVDNLTGSGPSFSYTAPGTINGTTVGWQLVVTDNDGLTSAPVSVDHNVLPVNEHFLSNGIWIPMDISAY